MDLTINRIPSEIIILFLQYFNLNELIHLTLISNFFLDLVKKTRWPHITVDIMNLQQIICTTVNYNFANYTLQQFPGITDSRVYFFKNCHTVNLSGCRQITYESMKYLANCHTLNLSDCIQLTDHCIIFLIRCKKLNLQGCYQITDESVKLLVNCEVLNLIGCKLITRNIIDFLVNCHQLSLPEHIQ